VIASFDPFGLDSSDCATYDTCTPWFLDVLLIIIALGVLALVFALIYAAGHGIYWLFAAKPCVGCGDRTLGENDKLEPWCDDCQIEAEMEAEPKMECPVHRNAVMKKERYEGVTIDRCPVGCVFLDKRELDHIQRSFESAESANLAMGVAIGSAIN
jgi:hypothetical protein